MKRGRPRKPSSKRMRSNLAPPVLQSPKKQLKWTNESMIRAMDAVKQGSSVKRAAEQHGVPRKQRFMIISQVTFNMERNLGLSPT